MNAVLELWLPILVSSVVVFVASAMAWMVLPHHRKDLRRLPDEAGFVRAIAPFALAPGMYSWPQAASAAEMKSEAFKERYRRGPWGTINVLGAQPNFGLNLAAVFLFYVVVGVFVAYVTREARPVGASYLAVFQVAGAVAVLAYGAGSIPNAIFFGKSIRFVLTDLLDAVVYGLLTAGVFAWLWPR